MPQSSKTMLRLLLVSGFIMLIPIVGQYAAVIILFVLAIPLSVPVWLVLDVCGRFGLGQQHSEWIVAAAFITVALASAAYFALHLRSQSNSPQQKSYYLNGVILALGTPAILTIAFFQLRALFPATFHQ